MKQTKKTLDVNNIERVIALNTNDTLSSHEITIRSLAEETVNATGYDPQQRYKFLTLDEDKEDIYASKNDLLTLASSLSSRASSTIGTKMEEEERQETMAARYEKLLQIIHEYERAPAEVRYVVAGDLNKAIDAMNQEQASVDKPYTLTADEDAFVDRVKHIQYLSSTASTEITNAFEEYKTMTPEAQQVVLPTIQNVYNSYMSFNRYEDEHAAVSNAYKELPKSFEHNITFSTDHLQYIGLTNEESILRHQLNSVNPQEMSHSDISKTLDDYAKLDSVSQTRLYGDYERIVAGYVASHPESAEMIATLQNQYLSNYASTELNRSEIIIKESIETMDAKTMSYESLVNTAKGFDGVPDSLKATLYENYQDLVDRYVQAHPPVESYNDLKSSLIQSIVSDYTPPETLNPSQQSLHDPLSHINPSTLSYESLDRMFTTYSKFRADDKIALYGDYERIITGYVEAHPRSEKAETLQTMFREDYVNAVTHQPHKMSAEDVVMREQMQAIQPGAMSYTMLTDTVANFDNLSPSSKVALYETYAATITGYESAHPLDRTPETIIPSMRETLMNNFKPTLYNAEENELREQVSTYNVSKMSFAQLESATKDFYNASEATRNALYNDYAGLIADYAESHPRKAAEAIELGQQMRTYQMDLADNRHTHAILDDCRTLYDNTSVANRESNIVVANRILDTYATLEPADREAVRGIVLESVEKFNGFELENVVRPVEKDPIETTSQRYSPAYYEIKDELVNGGEYAELGARARNELSLVEQRQIISLSAARENPEFIAPIQQEINNVNMIRETLNRNADGHIVPLSDAAMEQYAKTFTELSPQNRELVFHDFVEKYNASSHSPELLARLDKIDGFGTALETAVNNGTKGMTMRQYESTIEMLGNLPPQISNNFYTSNVTPLATWENYVNDNLTNTSRVERINEIFEGSNAFKAANIGDSFGTAAADKVTIAEIHELSSNVESFKKEDMLALFNKFEQHSSVYSYTSTDVARAFSEFSEAHPRWAASPEIQEKHVALVNTSSFYAAATGAEFARSLEENPPANANAMKKQIAEFEQLPFEAKEHAIGALTTAYVAYEDHSKTLTLNEQFEKLSQVAMQPQVYNEIMDQFDTKLVIEEFKKMSPERQEEIYTFALDRCKQTGIIANSSEVPSANQDISVRFDNLMTKSYDAANNKSPVFDNFVADNFDTTREGPIMLQYAEMSYDRKMELYKELADKVVEADLDTSIISGNVKTVDGVVEIKPHSTVETQFEQTTGKYLEQCCNAKLIEEQPMLESRLALSIGTNTDNLTYIKDYSAVSDNQHVASNIVSAATIVRHSMSNEIEREKAAAEFTTDCKDLSYAVSHRNQIVYARTTDDLARAVDNFKGPGTSEGAREYLAVTYINKVEGFYNSGATENQIYYGGFVFNDENSEKLNLKVDGLVGPNCFVGHVPGRDEQILVLTNNPIDIGVTRDNRDLYSTLSGMPIMDANKALEENAVFKFSNGQFVMDIPKAIDNDMENYQPASVNIRQQYEVLNVSPNGLGSLITIRDMENDNVVELSTKIKPQDIVRQATADVTIESDTINIPSSKNIEAAHIQDDIARHADAAEYRRISELVITTDPSELVTTTDPKRLIPKADEASFNMQDNNLTMTMNGETFSVQSLAVRDDVRTLVGYTVGDETKYVIVDQSIGKIAQESFNRDADMTLTQPNGVAIMQYEGEACLRYIHDDEKKLGAIIGISDCDGKASFNVIDKDKNIVTVNTDMAYRDAMANFEQQFQRSRYIHNYEAATCSFEKSEDGRILATMNSAVDQNGRTIEGIHGHVLHLTDDTAIIRDDNRGVVSVKVDEGLTNRLADVEGLTIKRDTSELTIGNGTGHTNLLDSHYSKNNSFGVQVIDADKNEFLQRTFSFEHLGSDLYTSQKTDDGIVHGKILYMNADYIADSKTIDLTVVEQVGKKITAYQVDGLTHEEFRTVLEGTKLHEMSLDMDTHNSLRKMNEGKYEGADVERVVQAFNSTQSEIVAVDGVKHQMEPGDLSRVEVVERDGNYLLRGRDHEGRSVTLADAFVRHENNELIAYGGGTEGVERYRIVGCAFGQYSGLDKLNEKTFDWNNIIEDQENRIFNNVNVEYTVVPHLNNGGTNMRALFEEKVGMSCETTSFHKISANNIFLNTGSDTDKANRTFIASQYGVLIQNTEKGPQFTYFNPSSESTIHQVTTTAQYLEKDSIPKTRNEAAERKFKLVDYEHGLAVTENGSYYKMKTNDLNELFGSTKPATYNPNPAINHFNIAVLSADNKYLPRDMIPTTPQDAAEKKFVLIDYDQGVAIREGGLCYKIKQSDIAEMFGESRPQNYYAESIAEKMSSIERYAQFVSTEQFAGKTGDIQPSVNNWSINVGADGKPKLSFTESSTSIGTSTIGASYDIKSITVDKNGTGIYAELVEPLHHTENTSSTIHQIRLCMPSDKQFDVMERATAHTVGDAGEKMRHYFEQVNDVAYGHSRNIQTRTNELETGKYVVVQNTPDEPGVLYKVVGAKKDLLIVGGTDDSIVHPAVLKSEALEGKTVTQLNNIPQHVESQLRFEKTICYAEVGRSTNGNVESVTIGERVHMPDKDGDSKVRVEGNTFRCEGVDINNEKAVEHKEPTFDVG